MTRKDFELIARVIKQVQDEGPNKNMGGDLYKLAISFSAVLADTNSRFDRERFLKACGAEI